jgi:hypothetical protein
MERVTLRAKVPFHIVKIHSGSSPECIYPAGKSFLARSVTGENKYHQPWKKTDC